jgi:hypothetical protein
LLGAATAPGTTPFSQLVVVAQLVSVGDADHVELAAWTIRGSKAAASDAVIARQVAESLIEPDDSRRAHDGARSA